MVLLAGLATTGAAASEAVIGETITLAGSAAGADRVYLFMIGPNLDRAGVALHDPTLRAAAGQFTEVQVRSSGRWEYRWNTGRAGLDPATYTIFAVNQPRDRHNLHGATYKTIPVTLRSAALTLETGVEKTGSLQVTVEPWGARVEIDGGYAGETPLAIQLPTGGYAVDISCEGYDPFGMNVTIYEGKTTSIIRTLTPVPEPAPLPPETIPETPEAAGWGAALLGAALCIGYRMKP